MPEPTFALLTQDGCPACARLKVMLQGPLRGAHAHLVRELHRSRDADAFQEVAGRWAVRATPTLVHLPTGATLPVPETLGIGGVRAFLDRHAE